MPAARSLAGLRVVCFESRRATEIAELVRRYGGEPLSAPAMRELSLEDDVAIVEFAERLHRRELDLAIFLTGVGTRILVEAAREARLGSRAARFGAVVDGHRGARAQAARRAGRAGRPADRHGAGAEHLERIARGDRRARIRCGNQRVAVQEYGAENPDLMAGLADRGARVSARADLSLGAADRSRAAAAKRFVVSSPATSTSHCSRARRKSSTSSKSRDPKATHCARRSPPWSSARSARSAARRSSAVACVSTSSRSIPRWVSSYTRSPSSAPTRSAPSAGSHSDAAARRRLDGE